MTESGRKVGQQSSLTDRAVADALGAMVPAAVLDMEGRILFASAAWCAITGWSAEEALGSHWLQVVHREDREAAAQAGRTALRERRGLRHDARVVSRDESTVTWVQAQVSPLRDEEGQIERWLLVAMDLTEHLRAEQALRESEQRLAVQQRAEDELLSVSSRLAALIGNMHLGVRISDQNGTTIAVNRSFLDILGLAVSPTEMMGESAADTLARVVDLLEDPEGDVERIVLAVGAQSAMAGARFALTGGRTLEASFIPIEAEGEYRGNMWLTRDLTAELAAATERDYLLELEKQQNARLIELDALKTGLVASVSHELRTPLTSIVSFTQLLREGLGVDGLDEQADFLDIIARNTDRLLRLVDDLLLLDRMESNAVETTLGPVDMTALVDQAASSIHPVAVENGVDLQVRVEAGPPLRGEADRLGQLVDNLLANAVKFTPPGGRVSVAARPAGEQWRLEISDTGIGIPAEEQERLFQRFFRASNARQQAVVGSGLGLAIVRRVAELHRGQVTVESVEGVGTTFIVTLRGALNETMRSSLLGSAGAWHPQASSEGRR